VLSVAREKARTGVCASNLKQIGLAIYMYAQDYDGWIPWTHYYAYSPGADNDYMLESTSGDYNTYRNRAVWMKQLAPYVSSIPVSRLSWYSTDSNAVDRMIKVFQCPTTWNWPGTQVGRISLPQDPWFNAWWCGGYPTPDTWPANSGHCYCINSGVACDFNSWCYGKWRLDSTLVRSHSSDLVLVFDAPEYYAGGTVSMELMLATEWGPGSAGRNHNRGINFLMADGHVEYHRRVQPATVDELSVAHYNTGWKFLEGFGYSGDLYWGYY
jgi:prepilin-type processing-associated H-X9-DG protein